MIIIDGIPGLALDETACIEKPASFKYNCIMHAIGSKAFNIWPHDEQPIALNEHFERVFWPADLPYDVTLKNFLDFFSKFKYELCDDENYNMKYRKIAIFCKPETDIVTHAALQHGQDFWTSKLGDGAVVRHKLHSVECETYGNVRCFVRRPRTITPEFDISVFRKYL